MDSPLTTTAAFCQLEDKEPVEMNEFQLFFLLAPMAAVSSLGAFVVSLIRRPRKILFLSYFLLCCFLIIAGQLLELTAAEHDGILFFSRLTYAVIAILPVFWFLFSLELIGARRESLRLLTPFLCLIPLATAIIAWTNPLHHLLWQEQTFRQMGNLTVNIIIRYGPWFWVHCGKERGFKNKHSDSMGIYRPNC